MIISSLSTNISTEELFNGLCREVWLERLRQYTLWGTEQTQMYGQAEGAYHRLKSIVLMEEVGEVAHAVLEYDMKNLREELIQVAAVAMAWLETLEKT